MIAITRNPDQRAHHQRILRSGPAGPEDFEEAQYLKDRGFAEAEIRISYTPENYGKPIDVIWIGPTALGRDYLDELTTTNANSDPKQLSRNPDSQNATQNLERSLEKEPGHFLKVKLGDLTWTTLKTTIGFIVTAAVTFALMSHFEFFQFLKP